MERETERLLRVADRIEREPWFYDQAVWGGEPSYALLHEAGINTENPPCGTAHCLAGHLVLDAWPEVGEDRPHGPFRPMFWGFNTDRLIDLAYELEPEGMAREASVVGPCFTLDFRVAAMEVLGARAGGLTRGEASQLFSSEWEPEEHDSVPAAIRALAAGVSVDDL